ncbi:hypothetical protein GGR57DRAFT_476357 [Xylariaceae sp. FL1272]|nr:hypothetical protein GGR57DRAFT_476357 [Xylariaceae sp. FL1272]
MVSLVYIVLNEIAHNPIISHYMSTVDLSTHRNWHQFEKESQHLTKDKGVIDYVRDFIERSLFLTAPSTKPDFWGEQILSDVGDPDMYTAHNIFLGVFLLTLFPNVTTLTLPWNSPGFFPFIEYPDSTEEYESVLNSILDRSRSKSTHASLRNLRCLKFFLQADYNIMESLAFINPLLALPNLEELYVTSLVAVDFHDNFYWQYPDINSNLRIIELTDCCMDGLSVSNLLAHTPNLTSFKYEHASKYHGPLSYWDAAEFMAAIEKHVGAQLRHLAITIKPNSTNGIEAGVTSMHGLTQLNTLEIDWAVFFGPSLESGEKPFLGTPPKPGYSKWSVNDIPPLRKILPHGLEKFILFVDINSSLCQGSLPQFFEGFFPTNDVIPAESCYVRQRGHRDGEDATAILPEQNVFVSRLAVPQWRENFGKAGG